MKKKLLLIVLFVSALCFSQQKQFNITWEEAKVLTTSTSVKKLPSFNKENFSFDPDIGLQFITQWESSRYVNEKSAIISEVTYTTISRSDLKDLNINTIPSEIKFSLKNSTSRDENSIYLELSPIVKDGSNYKKVTSLN